MELEIEEATLENSAPFLVLVENIVIDDKRRICICSYIKDMGRYVEQNQKWWEF